MNTVQTDKPKTLEYLNGFLSSDFFLPARVVLKTSDVLSPAPGQTLNPRSVQAPPILSNSVISVVAAVSLPVLLSNDL